MSGHEHGHQSGDHGGHQHGHSHQHDHDFDWETWAGQLELEADTLMPLIDEVVAQHTPDVDWSTIQHVLDLGCGPGVISCALAHHAPRAHVTALDSSVQLLTRVRAHAITQQVATRVHTVEADMEAVLPALRPMDVVWAGMVLHHVANAALVLAKLHTLLHPGGTLVMIEFADAPVALPPGDPAADAWNRLQVGVTASRNARLGLDPLAIDWPALLDAARFDHVTDQTITTLRPAPLDDVPRTWLQQHILRGVEWLEDELSDDDVAVLTTLADTIATRDDVFVQSERRVITARRPVR
ncbi:MAG: methyltransferase domain-containing protein [Actinomycetota bacterium]